MKRCLIDTLLLFFIIGIVLSGGPASSEPSEQGGSLDCAVSSRSVVTGDSFTLGINLSQGINETFDFYVLADTPYGPYTIYLNGSYRQGIHSLYSAVAGYRDPYSKTIWSGVTVPAGISGTFTFYAVAVQAGMLPPVSSLSQLTGESPYVVAFDSETVIVESTSPASPPVNSAGRSGSYYLPDGYERHSLPLMLAFHGTGGSGSDMVDAFRDLADEYGFIIVAPDSRKSPDGQYTWEVGSRPGEKTEDYTFALEWIDYVSTLPGVDYDGDHFIAVGFSGGGSSAPYIASNEDRFTAFAVLHGGVVIGGIGNNTAARGWFSTGTDDEVRPPEKVGSAAQAMKNKGFSVTFEVYSGGHVMIGEEKRAMVKAWLGL